ncbi:ATP-binding cassette domain-containing protein [Methylosoma difficile]
MSLLIAAEHLYRHYGKYCAVNDVSFSLAKGQVLGFLGPNGAGKTTTMQMLTGNLAASSGHIKINGFDIQRQAQQAKACIGYLPDTPPLYRELTTDEFLSYCARLHGLDSPAATLAVKQAKARCGLGEVGKRLIGNLSKGYQQRIGIAQAILHNPDIIILDEPTVGLDPLQIRDIRALIRELGADHGVILSTHILSEVQESCSHVQIIHQGQLILSESIAGLNARMDTGILLVTTQQPADVNRLSAIAGVNRIESLDAQRIRIHHSLTTNPSEALAETIINAGWGLQEITPAKQSMEDIFILLTQQNNG